MAFSRLYLSFSVSVASQSFRIGARDARTTAKAQMRRDAVNALDTEEKRLCNNGATAAHPKSPGICARILIHQQSNRLAITDTYFVAEGVGFEPTIRFPVYTLSKRAP